MLSCRGAVISALLAIALPAAYHLRSPTPSLLSDLKGQICVVTGASRGIGKGIAVGLGEQGCTVYITGRHAATDGGGQDPRPGTLADTCKHVEQAGGQCVPCQVDSGNDTELEALFERIVKEHGRLDVLVNNAFSAVNFLGKHAGKPFWELEADSWDHVNHVGLRSHYIASLYATRAMRRNPGGGGLIINVSSFGGMDYIFNVAYGIGKAAMDRMAHDMAIELETEAITMVSLWPGLVKTELISGSLGKANMTERRGMRQGTPAIAIDDLLHTALAESPLFSGRAVAMLARDKDRIAFTGKIVPTAKLAAYYGFVDERGVRSPPFVSVKFVLSLLLKPVLQMLGMWSIEEAHITRQAVNSGLLNFWWRALPDLAIPSTILKVAGGGNLDFW